MTWTSYDAAEPPVAALCASDAVFISCYTDGKYQTPVETVNAYIAAGKGILPNHERGAGDLLGGFAAGVLAAAEAMSPVAAWQCPQNGSVAIFYSADQEIDPTQYYHVADAFDGTRATHAGRWMASCYGQGGLIDYLRSNNKIDVLGWLSASDSYPGYNRDSVNVGQYQLVGSNIPGTDQNVVKNPTGLGVWYPQGVLLAGGGTIEPTNQGGNGVAFDATELQQITDAVWGARIPPTQPYGGQIYGDLVVGMRTEVDGLVTADTAIQVAVAKFNAPEVQFDAAAAATAIAASLNQTLPASVLALLKAKL